MIKPLVIRAIGRPAVVCALLAACAPSYPVAVQLTPPGPTPEEVADYAAAQRQSRIGLATGNGDAVAAANETFRQISREIFSRQNPRLFEAELVCERYAMAGPVADGRSAPALFVPQCENIENRYDEATIAIRHDLEARITASDVATIAQGGATQP